MKVVRHEVEFAVRHTVEGQVGAVINQTYEVYKILADLKYILNTSGIGPFIGDMIFTGDIDWQESMTWSATRTLNLVWKKNNE